MITGKFVSKQRRYLMGLIGCGLILAVLLPSLLSGRLDLVEYKGLDWLHRHFADKSRVASDIVILYIDQKSIDYFQKARGIGWPWPRDAYGLVVEYLRQAGARAVIFDAVYSEPSVFAGDFDDDNTFASAMESSGRVIQTLVMHENVKGGAPADEQALSALISSRPLDYRRQDGSAPHSFRDVTMPIPVLAEAAWALGVINVEPEEDGVVRRVRPLVSFRDAVFPAISLAAFLKVNGEWSALQTAKGLSLPTGTLPLDGEGMALLKYYGGLGTYQDYTIAAVIQSSLDMQMEKPPLLEPRLFKDKIVFIGAKAAALFDLRSTPMDDSLPGVEIHAAFLNNLLAGDFLQRGGHVLRGLLAAFLLLATLSAAVLAPSALTGGLACLILCLLYAAGAVLAFRQNIWLDLLSPLGGQVGVFILASVLNYYGEGREKKAVKGAFSRYLSPQVVAQVLEKPELLSLGGSRRVMTAFFSDLAGFTSISETLTPEGLVHLLNRYLSLMTGAILDQGGTLDKFEGDAIMAFWGAPLPQEDHALRACLAALEQQKLMAAFRKETAAENLPELHVRMGVNTGPMIVGNMGSEERFDYTVMGDAVNLASRLEGANKAFGTGIMISETTYAEVRDAVEVRELDLLRVKGKNKPITVYELLSRKGELNPEKAAVVDAFEQGLALYRDLDFPKAEEFFIRALNLDPKDGPSGTYLERCRAYRQTPPPPDWDRVFTLTTK